MSPYSILQEGHMKRRGLRGRTPRGPRGRSPRGPRRLRGRSPRALRFLGFVLLLVVVCLVVLLVFLASRASSPQVSKAAKHRAAASAPTRSDYGIALAPRQVQAQLSLPLSSGLLFDVQTGRVLWERAPQAILPMASVTKMMTALLVVEHVPPTAQALITPQVVHFVGSGIGLLTLGKRVPVETLLYGLLLPSGNDAAIALAQHVAVVEPDSFAYTPGRGIRAELAGEAILVGNAVFLREHAVLIPTKMESSPPPPPFLFFLSLLFPSFPLPPPPPAPPPPSPPPPSPALHPPNVLLTGDGQRVAHVVGETLGVDEVAGDLLPDQKRGYAARLIAAGKTVAMLGDGVNDAPALTQATVGVAMGSGTDVARESADVVLLGNDLSRFVATVRIARRTRGVIMQNFVGTIAVDTVGIALAAFGILNPLLAAFIHVASELTFILNSTRMLSRPAPRVAAHSGRILETHGSTNNAESVEVLSRGAQ